MKIHSSVFLFLALQQHSVRVMFVHSRYVIRKYVAQPEWILAVGEFPGGTGRITSPPIPFHARLETVGCIQRL